MGVMTDSMDASKYSQLFAIAYAVLLCFGIFFLFRIGFQGMATMKREFAGFPKCIDAEVLGKCLSTLCNANVSADVFNQLAANLPEYEARIFESFFCVLEKQSCLNFDFPSALGIGKRIFVPNIAMVEDGFATKMADSVKASKTCAHESYI